MILFFGTRPGKTEIKKLPNVACPYCDLKGTLTASKSSNWFHLFWIKLFKISTQAIAECSHCKRTYYENEFTKEMDLAIKETSN
ncbi:zinc-ribbon domain-containing protein [Costertonia aggregata]|uniref:Zinc-ribbon domain-containing protein n=1 Tax=Costertonia aggregata TaxID=343403 RepID=A0A7H9ALS7_9FLAO|nr:zinc-ribbon domain-containing protein [Costertonia aggregata]QLG44416.1 zinc-ribbon domain-containing protein [Costertonia aggregata]